MDQVQALKAVGHGPDWWQCTTSNVLYYPGEGEAIPKWRTSKPELVKYDRFADMRQAAAAFGPSDYAWGPS